MTRVARRDLPRRAAGRGFMILTAEGKNGQLLAQFTHVPCALASSVRMRRPLKVLWQMTQRKSVQ